MNTYILDENDEPLVCNDLETWSEWMGTIDRRVLRDFIDGTEVSTVFLGIDYRHVGDGPPILWETMTFSETQCRVIARYVTKLAALQGHAQIVDALERKLSAQSRHRHVDNAKGAHQHQHHD